MKLILPNPHYKQPSLSRYNWDSAGLLYNRSIETPIITYLGRDPTAQIRPFSVWSEKSFRDYASIFYLTED
jgi:hypothetical protein